MDKVIYDFVSSPIFSSALISAVTSTVVLFIFHAFPLNTKVIEKHLSNTEKDSAIWWAVASVYYFVIFLGVAIPMQFLSRKMLCKVSK